jgi:hypothetical protein
MERLWDVLVAQGVDPAADGWSRLVEARGVSDDGNTIVGYGWRNGYDEAFVAVVPEPGTWALLIGGGLAAAWFGLRRRRATLVASQNGVRVRLLVGSLMTVTLFSCWANANAALWLFDNISLTGTQEVPPNGSLASGLAQVMLDSDTREVNITGTYRNLAVVFTAAHLHGFADPGFTANVLIPLNHTGTTSGTFDGTGILADAAAVQEMLAGRTYINVHSPVYGGGEIRGQVTDPVAVPEPGTWALLIGGGLAAAWFGLRRRRQRAAGAQRSLAC